MNFSEVVHDIQELIGTELHGIRPGVNIVVESIDGDSLVIRRSNGTTVNRSIDELRRLWVALQAKPAIHVDSELRGSGTSRNHPETVLANLPYVVYLTVEGKKHLALSTDRHPLGSIRQATDETIASIRTALRKVPSAKSRIVFITPEPGEVANRLNALVGGTITSVNDAAYRFENARVVIHIIPQNAAHGLPTGAYPVLGSKERSASDVSIVVDGDAMSLASVPGASFLLLG